MKIWKLSLGKDYFNDSVYEEMIRDEVVSVNSYTKAKGQNLESQYKYFLDALKGDIFFLCHSNESIDLIGMFSDNLLVDYTKSKGDDWKYGKFITICRAENNQGYNKEFLNAKGKQPWWHPRDNSTFIEVKDIPLFEQEILKPVFNISSIDELNIKVNDIKKGKVMIDRINLLKSRSQIILQGPPGTGKTRLAKQMAISMIDSLLPLDTDEEIKNSLEKIDNDRVKLIQFHPSYSYEDFVRGIMAESKGEKIEYKTKDKVLVDMANKAYTTLENDGYYKTDNKEEKETILEKSDKYILIIDEINRANLSSVLGELIYALEYRDEAVESMYALEDGSRNITLPSNLYIIGTMNTADRSVGHIDYAIRRRFAFESVLPIESAIKLEEGKTHFREVRKLFKNDDDTIADTLSPEFDADDVMLGHSYFIADDTEELKEKIKYQVVPLLKEYIKDGVLTKDATKKLNTLLKNV